MSLINDALRRAKEAQQQQPPASPAGPPLRPVERAPARGTGVWLSLAFGIVFAAAAILLWQWVQQNRQGKQVVTNLPAQAQPLTPPPAQPATAPALEPTSLSPAPAPPVPAAPAPVATVSQLPKPAAVPASTPALETTPPAAPPVAAATPAPAPATTSAPPAIVAAPKPPLKLQGVIAHPTRPSVLISGKLLFIGDRIEEYRVVAIATQSATLVGSGRTNILSLD